MPNLTRSNTQENTAADLAGQFQVHVTEFEPERGVLATADVQVGDLMTIRNVRIKEDDYGLTVAMPKTKVAHTDQYKDSVFFSDKSIKEIFDQAVKDAYQDSILQYAHENAEQTEGMEPEAGMGMDLGM